MPEELKQDISHPSRVRGLKLQGHTPRIYDLQSHPSRVRGLKLQKRKSGLAAYRIAPFTGAWIETLYLRLEIGKR